MTGEVAVVAWLFLAAYIIWFLALAKRYVPLTDSEIRFLWKLHRRRARCSFTKFETIRHEKKKVGFRCACGYEYLSKCLLMQRNQRSKQLEALRKDEKTRLLEPVYLERYE
jgi:hypothetical protein